MVHSPQSRDVVLVVEDDPALRLMYRDALTAAGHSVLAVEDGLDALRILETRTPAAVVLDLGLPRLPGRDLHKEMVAHGLTERVPVVVVTADPVGIDEADFACVLRKPIDPDQLVSTVGECLKRTRRRTPG
jgi:two-component system KDP operon response regulator KdpE